MEACFPPHAIQTAPNDLEIQPVLNFTKATYK
jgi:hypothetical protein